MRKCLKMQNVHERIIECASVKAVRVSAERK